MCKCKLYEIENVALQEGTNKPYVPWNKEKCVTFYVKEKKTNKQTNVTKFSGFKLLGKPLVIVE